MKALGSKACILVLAVSGITLAGQAPAPQTHRLEATPATVAYGYYWSEAKPVLRIRSGDIIDVDTLLTNSPNGLQTAGVAPERIQASLRAVVGEVTGDRRGPGGHILTGPVWVEGAEPGDAGGLLLTRPNSGAGATPMLPKNGLSGMTMPGLNSAVIACRLSGTILERTARSQFSGTKPLQPL